MSRARKKLPASDVDLSSMTDEQRAQYYDENADRLDEIFDHESKVDFAAPEDGTTTITVRLKRSELEALSRAAEAHGAKLSTFVREAALANASARRGSVHDIAVANRKLAEVMSRLNEAEEGLSSIERLMTAKTSGRRRSLKQTLSTGGFVRTRMNIAGSTKLSRPSGKRDSQAKDNIGFG